MFRFIQQCGFQIPSKVKFSQIVELEFILDFFKKENFYYTLG